MIFWSIHHDVSYVEMAREMIAYAGYQDSVNDRIAAIRDSNGCSGPGEAQWVDDLYGRYANDGVFE